jgi:dienelactone hydrolase
MIKNTLTLAGALLLAALLAACSPTAPAPQADTAVPTAPPANIAAAEAFVADLAAGRFDEAVAGFDETMSDVMPSGTLADTWSQLLGQAGDFVAVQGTRAAREGGYDIVYVTTEFTQMPLDIKVVFDDAGLIAGLFFLPAADTSASAPQAAPPYADPSTFTEQEVIVGEGTEWALPGTLTLPAGEGPFPAVVLVHGSGPNDRDETIGPNKPFRDLAWGLAGQGIATLRYEKRTREYQQTVARMTDFTVQEETIDDALAAVTLLRGTPAIDPAQVYVLGHSLGGTLIPRIGAQTEDAAGLIVLAGADRPLEALMLEQFTYIFGLDGEISAEEQAQLEAIQEQITAVQDPDLSPAAAPDGLLGAPAAYWLDLRDYVPSELARTLSQPLLILQGERDYQVTMEDYGRWQAALADRADVTFKSYPALNHLFIAGEGPSTPAEYDQAGHVAEEVIRDIAGWIRDRAG